MGQTIPEYHRTHRKYYKTLNPEDLVNLILKKYIHGFKRRFRPEWLVNPKTGRRLELDFYVEDLKLAIEVQGFHHLTLDQKYKDSIKREVCDERGIRLMNIWSVSEVYLLIRDVLIPVSKRKYIPKWLDNKIKMSLSKYSGIRKGKKNKKFKGYSGKMAEKEFRRGRWGYFRGTRYLLWKESGVEAQRNETGGVRRRRELSERYN